MYRSSHGYDFCALQVICLRITYTFRVSVEINHLCHCSLGTECAEWTSAKFCLVMHCWICNSLFCELRSGSVVKDKPVTIHEKALFIPSVKEKLERKSHFIAKYVHTSKLT